MVGGWGLETNPGNSLIIVQSLWPIEILVYTLYVLNLAVPKAPSLPLSISFVYFILLFISFYPPSTTISAHFDERDTAIPFLDYWITVQGCPT